MRHKHSKRKNHINSNEKTVHELNNGESAKIVELHGGKHFLNKAESLGLRIGLKITKVSKQMLHGPVTVKVGQTQIAIGHNMSKRIIVE